VVDARELTPGEDRALHKAFGRFAAPAAWAAGATVVRRYQHAGSGHWFACDRLGPGVRPPVLVPVAEAPVRCQDPPWPAHAEECDFRRDPDEQRLVAASYARPGRGTAIRLVGKPRAEEKPWPVELRGCSYAHGRGALATVLAEILVRAGNSPRRRTRCRPSLHPAPSRRPRSGRGTRAPSDGSRGASASGIQSAGVKQRTLVARIVRAVSPSLAPPLLASSSPLVFGREC